jgi:hypothetical protein
MADKFVTLAGLNHDMEKKTSIVVLFWKDGSERHLYLPVSFGTTLENALVEAQKTLKSCADELALTTVVLPQ